MTTHDPSAGVDHPDWAPDCRCGVCHTCVIPLKMPDCELGEN